MTLFAHFHPHPGRDGIKIVQEVWDHEPERHPEWDVRDVSEIPGLVPGWVEYPDGRIGPWALPLEEAREQQTASLRFDCTAVITDGFTSDALGTSFAYGSNATDQANLSHDADDARDASKNWTASIWCADASGAWARRSHDAKQVRQVFADFRSMRASAQDKLARLTDQVLKASTTDIVTTIVW